MEKNVCIIHFNTPILTTHLVKSINKHTPNTNIYIFDNSDKRPFINSFSNVTVFDNTKGQIINFNEWLKKYPNRVKSGGKANNWGSAKHAYSVEKCMELIGGSFVLLDSDVLIKRDFTPLFDDTVCYKGEVIYQPKSNIKRVLPFICFINTPLCKKNGIHYFDENYMHGLRFKGNSDNYDTGGALYLLAEKKKIPHKEIKVEDFIVHYGNGSWVDAAEKMKRPKHVPVNDWLNKYKDFWVTSRKNLNNIYSIFDHIYCVVNLETPDYLPKIKEELARLGIDEKNSSFSWTYNFPSPLLSLLCSDKRLNVCSALKIIGGDYVKKFSLKHYEIIKEAYTLGHKKILIIEDTAKFHKDLDYVDSMLENMPDADIVMFDKMVSSDLGCDVKYKNYIKTLPGGSLYGDMNDSGAFYISSTCYSLNRKAMERMIELQESSLSTVDILLNDKTLTGSFAINNVAIRDPKIITNPDESYNKIGVDVSKYMFVKEPEKTFVVTKPVAKVNPVSTYIKPKLEPKPIKTTNVQKRLVKPKTFNEIQNPSVATTKVAKQRVIVPAEVMMIGGIGGPSSGKKWIEPTPMPKAPPLKPLPKSTGPLVTKRAVLPDKKITKSRIIPGKSSGSNKLYDE